MSFSTVSKDRAASREEGTGSAPRTAEAPLFSNNKVMQRSSSRPAGARSQGRILIVDDDASVRRALRTTLQSLGFSASEASGGEEALVLVCTSPYDVVLLDINLPGMDGHETCHHLRRLVPHIAILMLTVRDSEEDKVNALEAGA